ncbi:hypothetical protein HA49_07395 [Tatumella morbirosei]|uniref:Uncharacterized protein n=1 Tax=Tatumella morbirosei TaxID=642227 RepID=A0A095VKI4_9GAMM|nr:hypothetical protein HA49_07395 [Tatumella morbirosei]
MTDKPAGKPLSCKAGAMTGAPDKKKPVRFSTEGLRVTCNASSVRRFSCPLYYPGNPSAVTGKTRTFAANLVINGGKTL